MAEAPRFAGPDGVLREEFFFTTTRSQRFFTGTIDPDSVDVQVSVRGQGFTSDPDLITFEGDSFTIPNPSAFPQGLQLFAGANRIEVRSTLTSGSVTSTSFVDVTLSLEEDIGVEIVPPSGVSVEQFDGTVEITVDGLDDPNISGYNFYASTSPGGGNVGYDRINVTPVISGETSESTSEIASLVVDASKQTNPDGTAVTDPLFFVVEGQQQGRDGTVYATDFNEALTIPDTTTQYRASVTVESITTRTHFSFVHDRQSTFDSADNPAIPNSEFASLPIEEPLYYVVSAIYLVGTTEIESEFSTEVVGRPITVTPNVGTLPSISRQDIVRDVSLSIFRSQPQIAFTPGSTTRDTFIDPFSTEAERLRFVLDFIHNAQSFSTLLRIDDPNLTGESIPVGQSAYKLSLKQAFFIPTVDQTQALIDRAFDHRASNFGLTRREGRRARGVATFFLNRRPTSTITIPIGQRVSGGGQVFRTTSSAQITPDGAGSFFDPATGRYSVELFIQAEDPGSAGNLTRGQIRTVLSGQTGLQVINRSRTFGGRDQESNRDLANRALRAIASADSGRLQGYVDTASDVPGVLQVNVIDAGHPLMFRDVDENGIHRGGKVDVWVRGDDEQIATIVDTFAFSFEIAQDVQFVSVGDPSNLTFRSTDPRLSPDNPIIEMLDFPEYSFGLRNASQGTDFDLTNVEIVNFDQIQLDTSLNDPPEVSLTDVIVGDFRFRSSVGHVFERQPVREIVSFEGQVTGEVDPTIYDLYRLESPLLLGNSTLASDTLRVTADDTDGSVPSGTPVEVVGEPHVMLDGIEYLNFLGVNILTIAVFSPDRSVEYVSPFDPVGNPDYTIIEPDDPDTPVAIQLTDASNIALGSNVVVDYFHDENFSVTYEINSIVGTVQEDLDEFRHITADVVAKEGNEVPVDIEGTVVLSPGSVKSTVRANIRTNLTNLFNSLLLGEPVRQSDIIDILDSTDGVSYVLVPLTRMARQDGSLVIREVLPGDQESDFFYVESWSTPTVDTYLLTAALDSATYSGGGPENLFRGVFVDDAVLTTVDDAPNANGVPLRNSVDQAFIVGNNGLVVPGYTDDATLQAEAPFSTETQIEARRVELSANRVLITVPKGESPLDRGYTVTYVVSGDEGVKNIEPGPVSYLTLGNFEFVFDEDRTLASRQRR